MTITWTKDAGALAVMAAQRVQMLGRAQALDAHRWSVWKDHMNDFLKLLQTQGPTEWREAEQGVALVAGTAGYELNPRPYKVQSVRLRDVAGRDMPLTRWNRGQYDTIPYKTTPGTPTVYTVNRTALTQVSLTLWPVPNSYAAQGTLRVSYDRVINDIETPESVVDLPQEWIGMAADITGVRLAASFNLANKAVEEAKERGQSALIELLGSDHDDSITFVMED